MSKAPRADFALPAKQAFPLNTPGRVQVADKDAAVAQQAGSITPAEAATVKAKVAAKRPASANHNPDNFLPGKAFHKNRGM